MAKATKDIIRLQSDACAAMELRNRAQYAFDHGRIDQATLDKAIAKDVAAQKAYDAALSA